MTDPTDWVDITARDCPEQLFMRTPVGNPLTYQALRTASGQYAAALQSRGVQAGDRVAVQVEKSAEAVVLYVACLRMGAVYVPINVANTPSEVDYFLRDCQPRVAVFRPEDRTLLEGLAARAGVQRVDTLGDTGNGTWPEFAGRCDAEFALEGGLPPDSLAAIVYTSGTTGRSKGAMLTRGNLASNAAVLTAAWRFTRRDVLLHTLPLFHIHGLFAAINTVLASGSTVYLMPKFDPADALRTMADATVFMGVPTHYTRLLSQPGLDRDATARVRLFVSGSAPLLPETHDAFQQRTGHVILERYGMTETLMNTSNPYDGVRKPGSVGPPLQGISVRVVNPASGHPEMAPEVTGGLEVTGPNVFAGYWRDAEKTRNEFTADGWFKTGDLGRIDRDGYVHIVGRAKDLVISGGYNVYPKEVETALDGLPGVAESAVFGVSHADFGEGVTAVCVADAGAAPSEAALIQALQERLARYKVPKRILLIDELPRNAMGKVQKNVLRQRYADLYRGRS